MKKLMRMLFILNLMIGNGLLLPSIALAQEGASAAAAAGAGQDARAQAVVAQKRVEIPNDLSDAVISGFADVLIPWLNKNPLNKDAINKEDGRSLLMLFVQFHDRGDMAKAFAHLISMKPHTLVKNNRGRDILDILLSLQYVSDERLQEMARSIISLMIEQGANIQTLLERAQAQKNTAKEKIDAIAAGKKMNPLVDEKGNAKREYNRATMIIGLLEQLEHEQVKLELKTAKEALISQGLIVRDIGKIMEPSDPRLLAIKHAIEDNDAAKLAKALEGNKWLEIKDAAGYTPFLYAAYIGKSDMMRDLIRQGANIDAKTKDGVDATYFGDYKALINKAKLERHQKLEKEKKATAQKLKDDISNLFFALNPPNYTMLEHNARNADYTNPELINARNEKNYTALMLAALKGFDPKFVKFLLDHNADTSLTNDDQNTALHLAINEGHWAIAYALLEKMNPESIKAKNKNGFTVYDLAIQWADKYKDNADFQRLMEAFKKHGYPKN